MFQAYLLSRRNHDFKIMFEIEVHVGGEKNLLVPMENGFQECINGPFVSRPWRWLEKKKKIRLWST